jgi:hypothetical protein
MLLIRFFPRSTRQIAGAEPLPFRFRKRAKIEVIRSRRRRLHSLLDLQTAIQQLQLLVPTLAQRLVALRHRLSGESFRLGRYRWMLDDDVVDLYKPRATEASRNHWVSLGGT